MRRLSVAPILIAALAPLTSATAIHAQELYSFGVLGGSTVTNSGPTTITGNVGLWPGTDITGQASLTVVAPYTIHNNNAVSELAQSDLTTAFVNFMNRPSTEDLTGQDLGGLTLSPGVYSYSSDAQLTGTLTLDAGAIPTRSSLSMLAAP